MLASILFVAYVAQTAHPCQPCHAEIVASYSKTAMARTSGKVTALPSTAPFVDSVTQTTFTITGASQMQFSKGPDITGSRLLEWFIGSGRVGRSFLFREESRLFQAPVSYYTEAAHWQLSPGFSKRSTLDLARAVEPSCLNCHTTAFNPATLAITPGIGCERCHGDATQHRTSGGRLPVVNPSKLPAHERDSVCAQCHLTGIARVARFRPRGDTYRPGLKLSDFSAVFLGPQVASDDAIGVTSHFEKLALSRCKSSATEKLTCTSCHDPHSEPANASAFFNARCESCHQGKPCLQAPKGNCIGCHMPKAAGRGVDHSSYTDHSIPRTAGTRQAPHYSEIASYWPDAVSPRDKGLALAILKDFTAAQPLLAAAAAQTSTDVTALSQLAQIYERQNNEAAAQPLYEAILKQDPNHAVAAANLGVIRIKAGRVEEAISLWRLALKANPAQTGIRMNLAQALLRQGNREEAVLQVQTALRFDPDQPNIRRILRQLQP